MIQQLVRAARAWWRARRHARAGSGSGAASDSVYGHVIAPPRPTWAGALLALRLFALPAILLILILDLAVWAVAEALFGACVAIWCVL